MNSCSQELISEKAEALGIAEMIYVNKETAAETKYSLVCNKEFFEWWKWDIPTVVIEKLKGR